jgi:hypothetical protein
VVVVVDVVDEAADAADAFGATDVEELTGSPPFSDDGVATGIVVVVVVGTAVTEICCDAAADMYWSFPA